LFWQQEFTAKAKTLAGYFLLDKGLIWSEYKCVL